ncbi:autotransporter outer membrane beta-barrel domain-containing protein [Rahnella ecdela]|uniref:Autotransporter outer membrane beta-barrel domain-containing protein n=1 Tax=Rahnella ecdela TaxID=2816250 RepID=A0ABS6LAA4_9GAMM|nr:autotransporter outer membrane beta-barrel domain-containing protein [Rahnella ecdela]MBU9843869.1 autotransporter outer membrane beta-barrel domain-containing protein [Rahnella ecdela]
MKVRFIVFGILAALNTTSSQASFTSDVTAGSVVENELIDDPVNTQNVFGSVINSTINNGAQHVHAGGVVDGINNLAGTQTVDDLGMIANSSLNGGDANLILSGTATNVTINAGTLDILSGGVATETIITGKDSVLNNHFGADYNTQVSAGGVLNTGSINEPNQSNTAQSYNAVIEDGGIQNVQNGGISQSTIVEAGGTLNVQANYHPEDKSIGVISGVTNDSVVYGQMNNRGGIDNDNVVKDGGFYSSGFKVSQGENIEQPSLSNNLLIEHGGYAQLSGYSLVNNMTVDGMADSYDQTTLNDTVVTSGGDLTVEDQSHANNIINNGILNIKAAGQIDPVVTWDVITNAGATTTVWAHADTSAADFTVAGSLYFDGSHDKDHTDFSTKPQSYQVNSLDMQGGSVYLDPSNYSSLTTGTLSGNGDFYINTSIGESKGSVITVTGSDSGDFNVYAKDSGVSPADDSPLRVITATGGTAEFTLANKGGVVDAGTYEYHLIADGTGNWDLSTGVQPPAPPDPVNPVDPVDPVDPTNPTDPTDPTNPVDPTPPAPPAPPKPTYTPSTSAVLSMAVTAPIINDVEMHTVRDRIDAVRDISHDLNVWSRYIGSKQSVNNDAAGFDMNLNGVMLGADASTDFTSSHLTVGGFVGYTNSDVDFDRDGSGNVDSWSTGAYLSWLNNSGYYVDGIVKANRFSDDVNAKMTSGERADGDYNQNGLSAHLETGKYFRFDQSFVAPYVGITGFTTNNSNYTLSNGMKANVDSVKSLVAETGVNIGTTYNVGSVELKPYVKLAVADEMVSGNSVKVNNDQLEDDMSGVMGIYEAGVNSQITQNLNVGASVQYNHSDEMESPFILNAGFSLKF